MYSSYAFTESALSIKLYSIIHVTGFDFFFTQSKVEISLPISESAMKIMENFPIASFDIYNDIIDDKDNSDRNISFIYKIEQRELHQYLHFKENSNLIWINKNFSLIGNLIALCT